MDNETIVGIAGMAVLGIGIIVGGVVLIVREICACKIEKENIACRKASKVECYSTTGPAPFPMGYTMTTKTYGAPDDSAVKAEEPSK